MKWTHVTFVYSWKTQSVIVDGQFLEPVAYFQDIKYNINLTLKIAMILGAVFISIAILIWFKTRVSFLSQLLMFLLIFLHENKRFLWTHSAIESPRNWKPKHWRWRKRHFKSLFPFAWFQRRLSWMATFTTTKNPTQMASTTRIIETESLSLTTTTTQILNEET